MADNQGQWILCIQDSVSGCDDYVGPFRSQERAERAAERLRRNMKAVGAADQVAIVVEWCRPAIELEEIRDELLREYA